MKTRPTSAEVCVAPDHDDPKQWLSAFWAGPEGTSNQIPRIEFKFFHYPNITAVNAMFANAFLPRWPQLAEKRLVADVACMGSNGWSAIRKVSDFTAGLRGAEAPRLSVMKSVNTS